MNKVYMGETKPFSIVSIKTLGTSFVPSCLAYSAPYWIIGGNKSASSGHIMVGVTQDAFTDKSNAIVGIGYTVNGYLVFAVNANPYMAGYTNIALDEIADGTTDKAITLYTGGTGYGTDIVTYNSEAYVTGYGYPYPGLNLYSPNVPSFASTVSDSWRRWPIKATLVGTRPVSVDQFGMVGWKTSVGAQYMNGYIPVSSANITAQRIVYACGKVVVGGKLSDGTYIWYANAPLTNSSTWTAKKISSTSSNVIGMAEIRNRLVVAYYASGLRFYVSKTLNVGTALATDYTDSRFTSISTETAIDMKGNGSEAILLTRNGTTVHATRLV